MNDKSSGYKVRYEVGAQKALKKLDKSVSRQIMAWISKNLVGTDNPRQHGKGLVADRSGAWRYRIGNYRLIADINEKEILILILEIGHRRDVYKR
ncbi:type II toxin-antitoxin system RelE family toxin [Lactococcus insecticola]|uniref:Plasmid stabilization system protein n=1 Tax=Pseudolactococcus insecticola TaxID=2709158 RepID=A0A6A0B882_9LACT|nr:type II toxin-antitoxin system RelE/ParE family toxin [Lactococcus insecticola]GFH40584.1 plasmid stabilization system protein [Lactococcus insecticola]